MENSQIAPLINALLQNKGSDLHIVPRDYPTIRVDGALVKLDYKVINGDDVKELCYPFLNERQIKRLDTVGEVDGMFAYNEESRFRFNIYKVLGQPAAALRVIPSKIPTLDELKTPDIFRELSKLHRGLILVTGPTGSGKSTTLAAMINEINATEKKHIVTIEDPVEFLHTSQKGTISHREVENDTENFSSGLKYVLRQDPDVILIGEMRDAETITAALSAAETGHLVFGTLHTNSAPKSINRILDSFPAAEQGQIRAMLASSLNAVVSQTLMPKIGGGRVPAWEIMLKTDSISNLIREEKIHQIYSVMQLGQGKSGMQTQTNHLKRLISDGILDRDVALNYAFYPDELRKQLGIF